ncbi:MAG TPA: hypothetical protein VFK57_06515 [Vicinamibacterales bacterium]|nr:hypothetical protein [Vicinamibacterales bacterium]
MTPLALDTAAEPSAATAMPELIARLRRLAAAALPRMYSDAAGRYVFTVRRAGGGLVPDGISNRYSAITLIGLAADGFDRWRLPYDPATLARTLMSELPACGNLGDAALIAWAASAIGVDTAPAWREVRRLFEARASHPTVEVSWALAAATLDVGRAGADLQRRLSESVLTAWNPETGIFRHATGTRTSRAYVACYADQVYPIFALSRYAAASRPAGPALEAAASCATRICRLQGDAGQWYWHYDPRTGDVVEGYPVYAIHQDAMGPMALRAIKDAGGGNFDGEIDRGLGWLEHAPELGGGSLIDDEAGMLWRKVARREPMKLTRFVQAACTRVHSGLRAPGMDALFPPVAIDYEDRPYHWGWFLYAWAASQDPRA